jgi:CrcB protein
MRGLEDMGLNAFLAVGIGGVLGCWLRWGLAVAFNAAMPNLPMGTLAANLVGGLLMGCTLGVVEHYPTLSPELRLLIATGFLGGLTTFSTFAAESATLLLKGQYGWFAAHIMLHLAGSIAAVVAGLALVRVLTRSA